MIKVEFLKYCLSLLKEEEDIWHQGTWTPIVKHTTNVSPSLLNILA